MHIRENRVPDSLQKYLQTDSFSTRQAQQALNTCMQRVQKQLAAHKALILRQQRAAPWRQQKRSALICGIFKAIESEHPYLCALHSTSRRLWLLSTRFLPLERIHLACSCSSASLGLVHAAACLYSGNVAPCATVHTTSVYVPVWLYTCCQC